MKASRRIAPALLVLTALAGQVHLPPVQAMQQDKTPMIGVKLKELPKIFETGKGAFYQGRADEEGIKFYIPALSIMTPAAIVLESSDRDTKMTLQIKNDYSIDWDRTLTTDASGVITTKFRTEGPAVALIKSDGGMKPYRIAVWVGPEVKLHKILPSPFVTNEEYERLQGGGGWTLYAAIAAALLAAAVAVVIAKRRRSKA
jgi:hypothetical protein